MGEYFALILLAAVGMMFLVSSEDILMIFISLELTSLSLYILTAFNKRNPKSAEAALKYFLFGGMSAAFTLFGLSLLYGLSGATNLGQIAAAIKGPKLDPLLVVAHRDDGHRLRLQGGGGAVSSLGAGRLSRGARRRARRSLPPAPRSQASLSSPG